MINLLIDNIPIQASNGSTVLQASRQAGINIPTLCDHPELIPYGGCRLCLIEVEGARTLQTACTLPVGENMVVRTNTAKVLEARRFVLNLIFSERNHFCMYCQVSGGDCELQNVALSLNMAHWSLSPNYQPYAVDASHPHFVLDNNRCILCHRCVRACGDLVGNYTLGVEERGAKTFLVADLGTPLGESTCISCGVCLQVCPTGALIDRASAYRGKDLQVEHHPTLCIGCSVGCGVDVLTRDNNLVRIEGNWDSPVNRGLTCEIGRFNAAEEHGQRISQPFVRKAGNLCPATWEEALDTATAHLMPAIGKTKSGVTALISTRQSAETMTLFKQVFSDFIQSEAVTSLDEDRLASVSALVAAKSGKPFESRMSEIQSADCVVVVGANLIEQHQVAGFFVKRNLLAGTKLIVIDSLDNPLDPLADIVVRASQSNNLDSITALATAIHNLTPKAVSNQAEDTSKTVSPTTIVQQAAELITNAKHPVFIYGKGITDQKNTQSLKALIGLAEVVGAKLVGVVGEANSILAALYHLDKPIQLHGFSSLYLVLGDEQPNQDLIQNLENAPFTIVQAAYASPITARADVILPVSTWVEENGSYLNLEGRLQTSQVCIKSQPDVWGNASVLTAIAERLGYKINPDWKSELHEWFSPVEIQTA